MKAKWLPWHPSWRHYFSSANCLRCRPGVKELSRVASRCPSLASCKLVEAGSTSLCALCVALRRRPVGICPAVLEHDESAGERVNAPRSDPSQRDKDAVEEGSGFQFLQRTILKCNPHSSSVGSAPSFAIWKQTLVMSFPQFLSLFPIPCSLSQALLPGRNPGWERTLLQKDVFNFIFHTLLLFSYKKYFN